MTDASAALDEVYRLAEQLGLEVARFELDGEWHRCAVSGKKKGNTSGTYCLSEIRLRDGRALVVGMLNNFVSGQEERLTLDGVEGVSAEEAAESKRRLRAAAESSRRAKAELQRETAVRAVGIWEKLPDSGRSPYLDDKGVKAWGLRFSRGSIVVPARDVSGQISTLQFIDQNGNKRFLTGGAKRGRFHLIGRPEGASLLGIGEGYATAASVYEGIKIPIAAAFDAGNLLPVAAALKGVYPSTRLLIFADDDAHNGYRQAFIRQSDATAAVHAQITRLGQVRPDVPVEIVTDDDPRLKDKNKHHNTGIAAAILAAAAVDGDVVVPRFNRSSHERE